MSFLIEYRKSAEGGFVCKFSAFERNTPSPLFVASDRRSLCVGECFDIEPDALLALDWERNPTLLNEYCIAVSVAFFDDSHCVFASNNASLEPLYYYESGDLFAVSDDYWQVVSAVDPSIGQIDKETIEEMMVGGGVPLSYRTPVKGLRWIPGNTMVKFDAGSGAVERVRFSTFQHTQEVTDTVDAVESMDERLTQAAFQLKEKFPGKTFGVGLSGGLDSRVMLHYIQKAGAPVECFNTCTKRPHHVLLANSLKKSRALAKAAAVSYKEVEWTPEEIANKKEEHLRKSPLGPGGYFCDPYKIESKGMPDFDVLLTGGSGIGPFLVGCTIPKGSHRLTRDEIVESITRLLGAAVVPLSTSRWAIHAWLQARGIASPFRIDSDVWEAFCPKDAENRLRKQVESFVDARIDEGFDNGDIFFEIRSGFLSAINRFGVYESRLGDVRSFSYNAPFLTSTALEWSLPIVEDRAILKELIARKIPEFASIGEEEFGAADGRESKLSALIDRIVFLLRGSGIAAIEWYANDKCVKRAYYDDMSNSCSWFASLFPCDDMANRVWKLSPTRKNVIWDMKRHIDCIESRRYLDFSAAM